MAGPEFDHLLYAGTFRNLVVLACNNPASGAPGYKLGLSNGNDEQAGYTDRVPGFICLADDSPWNLAFVCIASCITDHLSRRDVDFVLGACA